MSKYMVKGSLKNILIPADLSKINTSSILEKIIALIEPVDSVIHILQVLKASSTQDRNQQTAEAVRKKLNELKENLQQRLPSINVSIHITTGDNVQKQILEKANELSAEMIVIIKKNNSKWLPFSNSVNATSIARETNAAVLIVNPNAIPNKIKSIVLPVRSFAPERNIELLYALTGNHKPMIHLVTVPDKDTSDSKTNIFINTYRTLSDLLHYPVQYKVLTAKHFSKIAVGYGKNIMADLIFVNPFEEAKKNAIHHTDISNMISTDSKLCMLIC